MVEREVISRSLVRTGSDISRVGKLAGEWKGETRGRFCSEPR